MTVHRLDLDVAIYRDRVQVSHRATENFVDQRAEFPFSSETEIIAHPRNLEDTLVRAMRQILAEGAFSLRDPIAHVVGCEGGLGESGRSVIEAALRETGVSEIVFELD